MKKKLLSIIVLIILVIGGGVAMKSIFTGEEILKESSSISSKDRNNELKIEKELAKKIISEYDGVKTIEFSGWGHSEKTGSYSKMATINNKDQISYSFDDNKTINSLVGYVTDDDIHIKERKEFLDVEKVDLSEYAITYSYRKEE